MKEININNYEIGYIKETEILDYNQVITEELCDGSIMIITVAEYYDAYLTNE